MQGERQKHQFEGVLDDICCRVLFWAVSQVEAYCDLGVEIIYGLSLKLVDSLDKLLKWG